MKLSSLKIHNVNSISDAEIDFEHGILAEEPLFLITGPTGAGKSTLLDAITLALYNKTPRKARSRKESITLDNEEIKLHDVARLLRHGTGEGYVVLTYEGNDGNTYTATWTAKRKRSKKCDSKRLLVDHHNNHTYDKVGDINDAVARTVGMDFDQFCRTTLLAQGEFDRFLKGDKKEKADILEKLTGTEHFGELGKMIHTIFVEKKEQVVRTKAALEGIEVLSDDQLAQIRHQLAEANEQHGILEAEINVLQQRKDWLATDSRLRARLADARDALEKARLRLGSPEAQQQSSIVEQYRATTDQRQWLAQSNRLQRKRTDLLKQTATHRGRARRLTATVDALQKRATTVRTTHDTARALLEREKEHKAVWNNFPSLNVALHRLFDLFRQIDRTQRDVVEREAAVPVLNDAFIAADNHAKQTAEEASRVKQQITDIDSRIKQLRLPQMQLRSDELNKRLQRLSDAGAALSLRLSDLTAVNDAQRHINDLTEQIAEAERQVADCERHQQQARSTFNTVKEAYSIAEQAVADSALELRHALQIGGTCPVCGAIVTDVPHDNDFESRLAPLRKKRDNAENEWRECGNLLAQVRARLDSLRQQHQQQTDNARQFGIAAEQHGQDLARLAADAGLTIDANHLPDNDSLNACKVQLEKELEHIKECQKQGNHLYDELHALRSLHDEATTVAQQAAQKVGDCRNAINQNNEALNKARTNGQDFRQKADAVIADVSPLMTSLPGWEQRLSSPDGNLLLNELEDRAGNYRDAAVKEAESMNELQRIDTEVKAAENAAATINNMLPLDVDTASPSPAEPLSETIEATAAQWTADVGHWHTALQDVERDLADMVDRLDHYYAHSSESGIDAARLETLAAFAEEHIAEMEHALRALRDDVAANEGAVKNATHQCNEHNDKRPQIDNNDTVDNLAERINYKHHQQQQCATTIGSLDQKLKNDDEQRRKCARQQALYEQQRDEAARWSDFDNRFGGNDGNKFRVVAQSLILNRLLDNANLILQSFNDHYLLCSRPGDDSLSILVEDRYSGMTPAEVSQLSGGETFMASLALALALAGFCTRGLGVDTLFIDEGFGSLDDTAREIVVQTLMHLREQGGRRVGIISHVADLEERIKPQINVKPTSTPGVSTIEVRIAD